MLRKLAALVVALAVCLVVPASSASADDYADNPLPTKTNIEIIVKGPGKPIVVRVSAEANSATPPEGTIEVSISTRGGNGKGKGPARPARAAGEEVWSTSAHFDGEELNITGPELPRGSYVSYAEFTPDNPQQFEPSSNTTYFKVAGRPQGADSGSAGSGAGAGVAGGGSGGLPNTGGPHLLWLLLGGGLVVAGSGSVAWSRRRLPVPA